MTCTSAPDLAYAAVIVGIFWAFAAIKIAKLWKSPKSATPTTSPTPHSQEAVATMPARHDVGGADNG